MARDPNIVESTWRCNGRDLSGTSCRCVVVIALLWTNGCGSDVLSERFETVTSRPPFLAVGDPATCPAGCLSMSAAIARAQLGMDPQWPDETIPASPEEISSALRAAASPQGRITSLSVEEAIGNLSQGAIDPIVLVSSDGHLYLLLGAIEIDGELMCQLVHGSEAISLVTTASLRNVGIKECWQFDSDVNGVPIKLGDSAEIRLNAVIHNFGEVLPDQRLEHTFLVTNSGEYELILDKPITSCGCMTTDLLDRTVLEPGATRDLKVVVQAMNLASMRQFVTLRVFRHRNGIPRQIELVLLGSQRRLMDVVPAAIDFGTVVPDEVYSRTIRISEAPTDRFVVKGVDFGKLPIDFEVEQSRDESGLLTYRIHCRLKVGSSYSATEEGSATIETNSRFRPKIVIPVKFKFASCVQFQPSVAAFGTVAVGQTCSMNIEWVTRNGELAIVEEVSASDGFSVSVDDEAQPVQLSVQFTPAEAGIHRGVVNGKVRTVLGKEQAISIRCAAFAVDKSDST